MGIQNSAEVAFKAALSSMIMFNSAFSKAYQRV